MKLTALLIAMLIISFLSVSPLAQAVNPQVNRAIEAYDELEWQTAITLLQQAMQLDLSQEDQVMALQYLAFCQIEEGEIEQAERSFVTILNLSATYQLSNEWSPKYRDVLKQVRITFSFQKRILSVDSDPVGANVYLDGVLQARKTPSQIEIDDKTHVLKLILDGYEDWVQQVPESLKGNQAKYRIDVSAKLAKIRPKVGSISVSSEPSKARIFLDGILQDDRTPSTLRDIAVGLHSLKLTLKDYRDFEQQVSVEDGIKTELNTRLGPLPLQPRAADKPIVERKQTSRKKGGKTKWYLISGGLVVAGVGAAVAVLNNSSSSKKEETETGSLSLTISY